MHIRARGQGHARRFQLGILVIAGTALLAAPAVAAGPVGAGGPVVVVPPKAPTVTPTAPVVTPTAPVIPQMPVVPNTIPSPITAIPGRTTGTKDASPADDANSAIGDVSTTRSQTVPSSGSGTTGTAQGISDQAASGNLTSFLRTPITPSTPQGQEQNNPIPHIDVGVTKEPGGTSQHIATDNNGTLQVGKLTRGATYDIQISGKDIEPALDRVATGKTGSSTTQPQQVLIALLLPAVQQAREARSTTASPTNRAFARGSKDQGIKLTIAIAKDGKATVDWGDGRKLPLGTIKNGTTLGVSVTAPVKQADVNNVLSEVSTTRLGTAPLSGTTPVKQADVNNVISETGVARNSTAPTSGTTPVARADVNNVIAEVSTARLGTAPTNGPTPLANADVNNTIGQIGSARSGTAPTTGTTPVARADVNNVLSEVSTTRLGTAPTNGPTPLAHADVNNTLGNIGSARSSTASTNGTTPLAREDAHSAISDVAIIRRGIVSATGAPGRSLRVTTDGKGNAKLGKLMRGETYDIQFSGKDLARALDRIASKTGESTAQPQKFAVLIGLLLPAVQKASGPSSRVFERSQDQAIHLSIAVSKDGKATIDWGDGKGALPLGTIPNGSVLTTSVTAVADNSAISDVAIIR